MAELSNDVFISYSRKDKEFARLLEQALEAYRPPRNLPVPQRNLVVFRDEADFTGVEYNTALQRHLESSATLIVICSSHSRQSTYVNGEIRQFAALRGPENIIPVLLSGIPNNEARPGQEDEKAFPEALMEVMEMPLAASYLGFDTRKDKVSKGVFYGSWYSVLANIYHLSRGEVEERDKKRQARARRIRTAIVSGVMAALMALTAWALYSRDLAVKQSRIALSRQLAAQALPLAKTSPDLALLVALEATAAAPTEAPLPRGDMTAAFSCGTCSPGDRCSR